MYRPPGYPHPWYHPVYYNTWHYQWPPHCFNRSHHYWNDHSGYPYRNSDDGIEKLKDYGSRPFVVDMEQVTKQNRTFRTALWTGKHLQLTLMSIGAGEDIGLEMHPNLDQFIRIEEGQGRVQMGDSKSDLDFEAQVSSDDAILIPAGKWHNLTNTGNRPLKLYSIYAPPEHPYGTVHKTKAEAMAAEKNHHG